MAYLRRSQYYRSRSTYGGYKRRYKTKSRGYKKGWMSGKRQSAQKYKKASESAHMDILNTADQAALLPWSATTVCDLE